MNLQKIALLILLAACARPAYSGSASAGESTSASASSVAPAAIPGANQPPRGALAPAPTTAWSSGWPALSRLSGALGVSSRAAAPVLVIPATEMTPETYDRIVEDLSVMSRIMEKNVASAPELMPYRMEEMYGPALLELEGPAHTTLPILRSSGARPKSVYIGGYGVLFCLEVKFPLVPPPEMPKPDKSTEQADQVWAAAQRELADPQSSLRASHAGAEGKTYKPDAVEGLRNALIATLRHATNIRDLEPESWLTILVQGPSAIADQSQDSSGNQLVSPIGTHPSGRTLLTLRAKKADIDQLAKGPLEQTEFQKRLQISTY